ncbi:MAG: hypothetical protein ACRDZM_18650 [Acidimicrobiia bacterium]
MRRIVAILGVVVAGGVFVLVAAVAPDAGAGPSTIRVGIALAALFAAGPVAALAPGAGPALLVSLGGGMIVAGAATTPGGNFLGPLLALSGLLLLWVGASDEPPLSSRVVIRLLFYAVLLGGGMWLAIDTESMTWIAAILLALIVGLGPWISHVGTGFRVRESAKNRTLG